MIGRAMHGILPCLLLTLSVTSTAGLGEAAHESSRAATRQAVDVAEAAAEGAARTAPPPPAADDDPYDDDGIVHRVLGEAWASLSAPRQGELRFLIGRVARIGFGRALREPADARVVWVRERTSRGDRIVDVVVEGSSLTRNYGQQLRKMLADPARGYDFAVDRLKRKIAAAA
ncbi:MAG TPA: hypothetical protein VIF09_21960 [Polyangiaceae bacterium]